MNKKVFILGHLSNDPNCNLKFEIIERQIEKLGFEAFNPTNFGVTWNNASELDYATLKPVLNTCDHLFLLKDFNKNEGAIKLLKYFLETKNQYYLEQTNGFELLESNAVMFPTITKGIE